MAWIILVLTAAVIVEKFVLLATGADESRIYYAPDTHADPILVGCLAGALFVNHHPAVRSRLLAPLALVAVIACVVLSQWLPVFTEISPLRTAFAVACALLIYGALERGPVGRLLSATPFVFVGRISYALYLWHVPILAALAATGYDGRPARSVLALCLTFVVATGSFYLVEQPLRKRWRRSSRRRALAPAVQPTA